MFAKLDYNKSMGEVRAENKIIKSLWVGARFVMTHVFAACCYICICCGSIF